MAVIKCSLKKFQTLSGQIHFLELFGLKRQKEKKGLPKVYSTTGGKNSWWRGWDLILDDKNYLNLRLISSLPGDAIHVNQLIL